MMVYDSLVRYRKAMKDALNSAYNYIKSNTKSTALDAVEKAIISHFFFFLSFLFLLFVIFLSFCLTEQRNHWRTMQSRMQEWVQT